MPASHEPLAPLRRAVVFALLVGIFLTEWLTPLGFAHGTLYLVPVALAGVVRDRRLVVAVGALGVAATIAGAFIAPPALDDISLLYIWGNRIISILAIAASSALAYAMLGWLGRAKLAGRTAQEAQAALERQGDLLRMAGEAGRFGGWSVRLFDLDLEWSSEVGRLFDQPDGAPPLALTEAFLRYKPEDQERVKEVFWACAERGVPFDEEVELQRADGGTTTVRTLGHAVRNAAGKIIEVRGAFQDLSALKAAERSLLKMQRHFQLLADSMPIIVWTAGPDGVVDYHNRALLDYSGPGNPDWQPSERWLHLVHPDDKDEVLSVWEAARMTEGPYLVQFRLRRADSEYRWFLTRAIPERAADGSISKWYGSSVDIHEQKQLEEEARALAGRLTTTLESITDAFITLDVDWRFSFLNQQAERLLGKARDELLGKSLWEEFPAAVGSRFETEYRIAMESGNAVHFEEKFAPLGLVADISAYPSSEGLSVYLRDVSLQREAQAQLLLLQSAVARLADIVVIAKADEDGASPQIVFVNDAFQRVTGYRGEEALGRQYGFMAGPNTDPAALDRLAHAFRNWQPVRTEILCYKRDGRDLWLEIDLVPLADSHGRFTHWVGIERDITERMAIEGHLRQSQRLEALGQLTGGIAHDFNNLLTVILGNAEILSADLSAVHDQKQLADVIAGAAVRGAELTSRLLAFARKQALEPRAVNVNQLVTGMEPLLRRTLGEHIDIELVCGAGVWPALIDPGQLEDALLNLCLNARDAMPGGGRLTLETANTRLDHDYAEQHPSVEPGQYILVAVSDTGHGISADILERVFEPFFSTKEKGKGTGLGLSMVYGFIKQSGGHINVYSEHGEGTTVRMYLPRSQAQPLPKKANRKETESAGGKESILVVEDDTFVRRFAVRELVRLGYSVFEAENGPAALELLSMTGPVDLLFTDVVMPGGLSGRRLADEVSQRHPSVKVLFTSGYTDNAIVHHGRLDPGVHLLAKPYRRIDLARTVRRVLDESLV
jgi:PAS domain S-box-containing protein